jgi:hypothetical protein
VIRCYVIFLDIVTVPIYAFLSYFEPNRNWSKAGAGGMVIEARTNILNMPNIILSSQNCNRQREEEG